MPPRRVKRKGGRQRFYARNADMTTFDGCVWAFDAFGSGQNGQFLLYAEHTTGAGKLRGRGLRHAGPALCLSDDADADGHLRYRAMGAFARRHGDGDVTQNLEPNRTHSARLRGKPANFPW